MVVARDIHGRLREAGYSSTRSRRVVLEALARQPSQFTASELFAAVEQRDSAIGRATVFRTLELLESLAIVERIHGPHGCSTYTLCHHNQHHHHLICRICRQVVEVVGCGLSDLIQKVSEQRGFAVEGHVVLSLIHI